MLQNHIFKDVNIDKLLEYSVFVSQIVHKIMLCYQLNHLKLLLRPTKKVLERKGLRGENFCLLEGLELT